VNRYLLFFILFVLSGCIGTDIINDQVSETLTINTRFTSIKVGETVMYEATYLNNVGEPEEVEMDWSSSDFSVISIDEDGQATALSEGQAVIMVSFLDLSDEIDVEAGAETIMEESERMAELRTTSSYPLSGMATLKIIEEELHLDLSEDFSTTSDLPGLYVYLTNNVNSVGSAIEIGKVTDFTGAQRYKIPGNPGILEYNYVLFYCKPFSVPVGNGKFE
jgi:hypothetical protein